MELANLRLPEAAAGCRAVAHDSVRSTDAGAGVAQYLASTQSAGVVNVKRKRWRASKHATPPERAGKCAGAAIVLAKKTG